MSPFSRNPRRRSWAWTSLLPAFCFSYRRFPLFCFPGSSYWRFSYRRFSYRRFPLFLFSILLFLPEVFLPEVSSIFVFYIVVPTGGFLSIAGILFFLETGRLWRPRKTKEKQRKSTKTKKTPRFYIRFPCFSLVFFGFPGPPQPTSLFSYWRFPL